MIIRYVPVLHIEYNIKFYGSLVVLDYIISKKDFYNIKL